MGDALAATVLTYIQERHVLTLATTGSAGVWAAAVFYVADRFELVFLSNPNSRHAQNLSEKPRAAGAIHDNVEDWHAIKGVQLEGAVRTLMGSARERAIAAYVNRFSFLQEVPQALQHAFESVTWYRLTPDRLYFIDNSRGFGHRDRIF